ncbi:hypothetical protein DL764_003687 [Monosporascus ibericus]|uniref:Uncharacterized protein n=1 Tax=Monosporascus ibericus TaxID=155417 RepID=A0A4Q4TI37_9PEZI|nr:hypothetical protein DL764_003687 [Monosporascus ibericus]
MVLVQSPLNHPSSRGYDLSPVVLGHFRVLHSELKRVLESEEPVDFTAYKLKLLLQPIIQALAPHHPFLRSTEAKETGDGDAAAVTSLRQSEWTAKLAHPPEANSNEMFTATFGDLDEEDGEDDDEGNEDDDVQPESEAATAADAPISGPMGSGATAGNMEAV